ncbi:hypothetical protein BDN70DRAFT_902274 [Pholiota conissans]|uniref:Uncharacterized protein n=1 Tax=Pholiota conissans TaxID=109636 RepID=A0A9P5YK42_9AGAR|nr:hypothetical protein BDN70DRAFT_902274 [Pholiota conissans]
MSNTDRFAPFRLQAISGLNALTKIPNLWTDEGEYYERIMLLLEELQPLLDDHCEVYPDDRLSCRSFMRLCYTASRLSEKVYDAASLPSSSWFFALKTDFTRHQSSLWTLDDALPGAIPPPAKFFKSKTPTTSSVVVSLPKPKPRTQGGTSKAIPPVSAPEPIRPKPKKRTREPSPPVEVIASSSEADPAPSGAEDDDQGEDAQDSNYQEPPAKRARRAPNKADIAPRATPSGSGAPIPKAATTKHKGKAPMPRVASPIIVVKSEKGLKPSKKVKVHPPKAPSPVPEHGAEAEGEVPELDTASQAVLDNSLAFTPARQKASSSTHPTSSDNGNPWDLPEDFLLSLNAASKPPSCPLTCGYGLQNSPMPCGFNGWFKSCDQCRAARRYSCGYLVEDDRFTNTLGRLRPWADLHPDLYVAALTELHCLNQEAEHLERLRRLNLQRLKALRDQVFLTHRLSNTFPLVLEKMGFGKDHLAATIFEALLGMDPADLSAQVEHAAAVAPLPTELFDTSFDPLLAATPVASAPPTPIPTVRALAPLSTPAAHANAPPGTPQSASRTSQHMVPPVETLNDDNNHDDDDEAPPSSELANSGEDGDDGEEPCGEADVNAFLLSSVD